MAALARELAAAAGREDRAPARRDVLLQPRELTLALLCAVGFIDLLDGPIGNIALPEILTHVGFPVQSLQWVASAYLLIYGGFLLLGGRAADLMPLQPQLAASRKPRFRLKLAVAGISAQGPFDDAADKGVVELLPRKPPAVKDRPGDRRREFGYIEVLGQLAAGLGLRRDRAEPRHHAGMSARLKLGHLVVALGGVDDRGHRGRPPPCLQAFSQAQCQSGQVTPETAGGRRLKPGGELHDGVEQQG
jgi:hypothetical protein